MSEEHFIGIYIVKKKLFNLRTIKNILSCLGRFPKTDESIQYILNNLSEPSDVILPETKVNDIQLTINFSGNLDHYNYRISDNYSAFEITVPEGNVCDVDGQHERLYRIILKIFNEVGATFFIGTNTDIIYNDTSSSFQRLLGGIYIFRRSDDLKLPILSNPNFINLDDDLEIIRFNNEFYWPMPESDVDPMIHYVTLFFQNEKINLQDGAPVGEFS